jgi:hypothetical protein
MVFLLVYPFSVGATLSGEAAAQTKISFGTFFGLPFDIRVKAGVVIRLNGLYNDT